MPPRWPKPRLIAKLADEEDRKLLALRARLPA
jgi:hypothetical protein